MSARAARPVDPGDRPAAGSGRSACSWIRAAIGLQLDPGSGRPAAGSGQRPAQRKRKPPAQGRGLEGRGARPVDQASS
jgi:hypothetical protein